MHLVSSNPVPTEAAFNPHHAQLRSIINRLRSRKTEVRITAVVRLLHYRYGLVMRQRALMLLNAGGELIMVWPRTATEGSDLISELTQVISPYSDLHLQVEQVESEGPIYRPALCD